MDVSEGILCFDTFQGSETSLRQGVKGKKHSVKFT